MTSVLRAKSGGVWRGPVADGTLKVKENGVWKSPSYIKVKRGGAWVDTGYRGYPNPPQGISVNAWSFSAVSIAFTGPAAGGAPTTGYDIQQRNSAGTVISTLSDTASPSANFSVVEDGKYQFYVRSKSAAGLVSAWVGPVKVQIGHTEQGYTAVENRTRGWTSAQASGARNANEPFWHTVGSNIKLTGMHWRNLRTPMSSVVTPGTNRTVAWYVAGGDYGVLNDTYGTISSGDNRDHPLNNVGNGTNWGIVPRGAGWSTTSNGTYMLWCDAMWVSGIETYQVNVYYVTRAYAGNSYW